MDGAFVEWMAISQKVFFSRFAPAGRIIVMIGYAADLFRRIMGLTPYFQMRISYMHNRNARERI